MQQTYHLAGGFGTSRLLTTIVGRFQVLSALLRAEPPELPASIMLYIWRC